ncbi:MAG: hypothetical protein AWT59_0733 [Candidatus Gallionella acididurans]|jgi:hypothetical protein|uniref:Uncharacterized protein n=1 Tax=Candidatus Gallionella acididurans TaxID=1796491 RepID=A0A139BW09_9PROT|nr:MAG: hypothetical protein AWT59_0733 [Candidatus Gallionella acididurans]
MNKDPVEEVLKEPAELPEIRFPVKRRQIGEGFADNKDDIEKLGKFVAEAFAEIASATGLSDKEVLRVIKDTDVEMLGDVLKDGTNVDALKEGIQEAIKKISMAVDLDTKQISEIFIEKKDAGLDDIVTRLYNKGQANRAKFGN